MTAARIEHVLVGGDPDPWERLGMIVSEGTLWLHGASIRFVDAEPGIHGWTFSGLDERAVGEEFTIDGLASTALDPAQPTFAEHPLGVTDIDHLVVSTGTLERTSDAITAATGGPRKRIRETDSVRQGFHRFGGVIVEIVEQRRGDAATGAAFFGIAFNVDDIGVLGDIDDELVGVPKDAVQEGRQIATVRSAAGLGVPVAFMSQPLR